MLTVLLIASLAALFRYIGDTDYYNKGWLLAIISVVASLLGSIFGLLGAFGANLLLYLILLIYNVVRRKPPGSESGW